MPPSRRLSAALVTLVAGCAAALLAASAPARADSILLFDDFSGGLVAGSASSGIGFTPSTALFPSNTDGIGYAGSLFSPTGSMEVRLRIDEIGSDQPTGHAAWSTIFDSRGALGRQPGDIIVFVEGDGQVFFTLNVGIENPIANPVRQVQSASSIFDGEFHTVAIAWGVGGMKLLVDGVLEDSDPYAGVGNGARFALGDYDEGVGGIADSSYHFGFEGEVDWIRISAPQPAPEPNALSLLAGAAAAGLGVRLTALRAPSR